VELLGPKLTSLYKRRILTTEPYRAKSCIYREATACKVRSSQQQTFDIESSLVVAIFYEDSLSTVLVRYSDVTQGLSQPIHVMYN
jgi:hypothetical protein